MKMNTDQKTSKSNQFFVVCFMCMMWLFYSQLFPAIQPCPALFPSESVRIQPSHMRWKWPSHIKYITSSPSISQKVTKTHFESIMKNFFSFLDCCWLVLLLHTKNFHRNIFRYLQNMDSYIFTSITVMQHSYSNTVLF